jgi:hypothetical protein
VKIYAQPGHPELPLKFELNVGSLGKMWIYIKSTAQVEKERVDVGALDDDGILDEQNGEE